MIVDHSFVIKLANQKRYCILAVLQQLIDERVYALLPAADAALYQALHRLERKGLVESQWGVSDKNHRAKYYELTAAGREQLRAEAARWSRYSRAVTTALEATTA